DQAAAEFDAPGRVAGMSPDPLLLPLDQFAVFECDVNRELGKNLHAELHEFDVAGAAGYFQGFETPYPGIGEERSQGEREPQRELEAARVARIEKLKRCPYRLQPVFHRAGNGFGARWGEVKNAGGAIRELRESLIEISGAKDRRARGWLRIGPRQLVQGVLRGAESCFTDRKARLGNFQ